MIRTVARTLSITVFLTGSLVPLWSQEDGSSQQAPADNTKVNQRDRNPNERTADQQKENAGDRQLTQQIRRAIVKDKALSTDAHNVKVITQNGTITLKGPVKSEQEKQAIESKATEIAGSGKVTNELQVAPNQ